MYVVVQGGVAFSRCICVIVASQISGVAEILRRVQRRCFLPSNASSNFTAPNESSGCFLDTWRPIKLLSGSYPSLPVPFLPNAITRCGQTFNSQLFPTRAFLFYLFPPISSPNLLTLSATIYSLSLEAIYDLGARQEFSGGGITSCYNTRPALMR